MSKSYKPLTDAEIDKADFEEFGDFYAASSGVILEQCRRANQMAEALELLVRSGHPMNGACSTDHYSNRKCNCGYELAKKTLAAYRGQKAGKKG